MYILTVSKKKRIAAFKPDAVFKSRKLIRLSAYYIKDGRFSEKRQTFYI